MKNITRKLLAALLSAGLLVNATALPVLAEEELVAEVPAAEVQEVQSPEEQIFEEPVTEVAPAEPEEAPVEAEAPVVEAEEEIPAEPEAPAEPETIAEPEPAPKAPAAPAPAPEQTEGYLIFRNKGTPLFKDKECKEFLGTINVKEMVVYGVVIETTKEGEKVLVLHFDTPRTRDAKDPETAWVKLEGIEWIYLEKPEDLHATHSVNGWPLPLIDVAYADAVVSEPVPEEPLVVETPAEEPAEETPAEETPAEETPAEETPAEETPAEEPAEETPAEEAPAELTPVGKLPINTPSEEPVEETPDGEISDTETPLGEPSAETPSEEPAEEPAEEETPAEEPAAEEPAEELPTELLIPQEAPVEEPAEEEPEVVADGDEEVPAEEPQQDAEPAAQPEDPLANASVSIEATWEGDLMLGSEMTLNMSVDGPKGAYQIFWEVNKGNGWERLSGVHARSYTFALDEENMTWQWRAGIEAIPEEKLDELTGEDDSFEMDFGETIETTQRGY